MSRVSAACEIAGWLGGTIDRKVGRGSLQHLSGTAIDAMCKRVEGALHSSGAASPAKIRDFIEQETGEAVSRRTVGRALHRERFAPKRRRPGPAVMDRHKDIRQVWSLLHRADLFGTTVFIDEANFNSIATPRSFGVRPTNFHQESECGTHPR